MAYTELRLKETPVYGLHMVNHKNNHLNIKIICVIIFFCLFFLFIMKLFNEKLFTVEYTSRV